MTIKRLFLIIDLLLIAIAVFLGVKGIYAFLASRLDTAPQASTVQSASSSVQRAAVPPYSDFQSITKRNLFQTGTAAKKSKEDIVLDSLEETELKLKLWGTVAADNSRLSFAIIEDETKREQNVYKIDDTIQNATVKMILADKVVLSVSGRDEVLQLERRSSGSSSSARSTTSSVRATASRNATTTTRISLRRTQVESAMENLTELMTQITIKPYNEGGVEGLSLSNIKANSLFRRMGLRNGDVLVAVEGQALTSADQAYQLYESLKTSDSASVEINRRGRARVIQYRIR
jgi:general secretion pathway protein C